MLERHPGVGAGAAILLRNVSVFSTSARKHFVNIVPSNVGSVASATSKFNADDYDGDDGGERD